MGVFDPIHKESKTCILLTLYKPEIGAATIWATWLIKDLALA